eukprot:CAMPEP_0202965300 /NCGR_PEP_ID=MMETSP1396-20130829/9323_1 /ASSEMBLY_ACC=CAM_ASM_000872 /TAXON_ID= /ORGANISM="Pseudokeronopsis sp., Strain Brazil" /LENGTH=94 /DNA_ID=CAMNT_0049687971 /DNA_START=896 /DNA_END=1180 /DNA_ORIENTATION=+
MPTNPTTLTTIAMMRVEEESSVTTTTGLLDEEEETSLMQDSGSKTSVQFSHLQAASSGHAPFSTTQSSPVQLLDWLQKDRRGQRSQSSHSIAQK